MIIFEEINLDLIIIIAKKLYKQPLTVDILTVTSINKYRFHGRCISISNGRL